VGFAVRERVSLLLPLSFLSCHFLSLC
jgi:hypothetical protein